jgi:hypothetical protein
LIVSEATNDPDRPCRPSSCRCERLFGRPFAEFFDRLEEIVRTNLVETDVRREGAGEK